MKYLREKDTKYSFKSERIEKRRYINQILRKEDVMMVEEVDVVSSLLFRPSKGQSTFLRIFSRTESLF